MGVISGGQALTSLIKQLGEFKSLWMISCECRYSYNKKKPINIAETLSMN